MWVQKCDICGKEIKNNRFRYKVKVEKEESYWEDHWRKETWSRLDICDDCQERIVELIKQRNKTDLIKKAKTNVKEI